MFWGFLEVWLLKACQDQGRVVLGVGVGSTHCLGVWVPSPTHAASGHRPQGGSWGVRARLRGCLGR